MKKEKAKVRTHSERAVAALCSQRSAAQSARVRVTLFPSRFLYLIVFFLFSLCVVLLLPCCFRRV